MRKKFLRISKLFGLNLNKEFNLTTASRKSRNLLGLEVGSSNKASTCIKGGTGPNAEGPVHKWGGWYD